MATMKIIGEQAKAEGPLLDPGWLRTSQVMRGPTLIPIRTNGDRSFRLVLH